MEVDWKRVSSQCIRGLRGRLSQWGASRRLGFAGNPVREWEAGRRHPTATQALALAALDNGNVGGLLRQFHEASAHVFVEADAHGDSSETPTSGATLARWLRALKGTTSLKLLTTRCDLSRFTVSRMLAGQTSLRFPEFLALLHAITVRADDFVLSFVGPDDVPALPIDYSRGALRRAGLQYPWTHALLRLAETEEYEALETYPRGWFAARLRIPVEEEDEILACLLREGVLTKDTGRLVPHAPEVLYLGAKSDEAVNNKRHFTRVVDQRLAAGLGSQDYILSNTISLSRSDYRRVRDLLEQTSREIRAIVRDTEAEEVAALVGLHALQWAASE